MAASIQVLCGGYYGSPSEIPPWNPAQGRTGRAALPQACLQEEPRFFPGKGASQGGGAPLCSRDHGTGSEGKGGSEGGSASVTQARLRPAPPPLLSPRITRGTGKLELEASRFSSKAGRRGAARSAPSSCCQCRCQPPSRHPRT